MSYDKSINSQIHSVRSTRRSTTLFFVLARPHFIGRDRSDSGRDHHLLPGPDLGGKWRAELRRGEAPDSAQHSGPARDSTGKPTITRNRTGRPHAGHILRILRTPAARSNVRSMACAACSRRRILTENWRHGHGHVVDPHVSGADDRVRRKRLASMRTEPVSCLNRARPVFFPAIGLRSTSGQSANGTCRKALRLDAEGMVKPRRVVLPRDCRGQLHRLPRAQVSLQIREQVVSDIDGCPRHGNRIPQDQPLQLGERRTGLEGGEVCDLLLPSNIRPTWRRRSSTFGLAPSPRMPGNSWRAPGVQRRIRSMIRPSFRHSCSVLFALATGIRFALPTFGGTIQLPWRNWE